jgi:HprK-related kinase B
MIEIEKIARDISANYELIDDDVRLQLEGCQISIRSNSNEFLKKLAFYFAHALADNEDNDIHDIEIIAIERESPELGLTFIDWKREPGKTGRKDSYIDLVDGRVIRKVRTGMIFLQSNNHLFAVGPCLENDNQVINFINAQYMNLLQRKGALICHASAIARNEECFAIAALSAGGKSTLMLNILEEPHLTYVTNDRLLLKRVSDSIEAYGIPKLPRVNPGTIINNDRLRPMLSETRQKELMSLPKEDLWDLEEKYDVLLQDLYGSGKIISKAKLKTFLILNWQSESNKPCDIQRVNLSERKDLLQAIMKSPGPFYQYQDGSFFRDDTELDEKSYYELLKETAIYEASGKVNFDFATRYFLNHIIQ